MKKRAIGAAVLSAVTVAALAFGTNSPTDAKAAKGVNNQKAKNVILFVGDGMGTDHRDAIDVEVAAGAAAATAVSTVSQDSAGMIVDVIDERVLSFVDRNWATSAT